MYKKVMKGRYMRAWSRAFKEAQELHRKDQVLVSMQERLVLIRTLEALREITRARSDRRVLKRAADQEYVYWLGKRAINTLRCYKNWRRASHEMSNMVVADYSLSFKKKVYKAM